MNISINATTGSARIEVEHELVSREVVCGVVTVHQDGRLVSIEFNDPLSITDEDRRILADALQGEWSEIETALECITRAMNR